MQRDWPRPTCVVWCTASYVSVPDLDTMPEGQTQERKTILDRIVIASHVIRDKMMGWFSMFDLVTLIL